MKKFLYSALLLVTVSLQAAIPTALVKKRMLSDLDFIKSVFEVKYAPAEWKQEYAGWNLDTEVDKAKERITNDPQPTVKKYHRILRDMFNSTCDYHVGIVFYSTEEAYLPFMVKSAGNRYFIAHADKHDYSNFRIDLAEGDELLSFGGKPIDQVVQELRRVECGQNTPETDQALAELMLTVRSGAQGCSVPKGFTDVVVKKKSTGEQRSYRLKWNYTPEMIRDISKLGSTPSNHCLSCDHPSFDKDNLKINPLFDKQMVCSNWKSYANNRVVNPHVIGARKSFLPPLGEKLWQSNGDMASFDAYIFLGQDGESKIGYIRIPHFFGDEEDVREFGEILSMFEANTDGLVIDQVNNPGGSIFYLYALTSMLTDKPLYTPKHHLMLTQEEVHMAVHLLPVLEEIRDDRMAREIFGENIGGYPVDFELVRLLKQFCLFIYSEWNEGHLYTSPTFIMGIDDIRPHPDVRFTKPILLLTNPLDFSGADFFPAIMQDNKRATILGTRTAGAGGYVLPTNFPNQTGILGFHLTGSLAERIDHKPIENLGVQPDVYCAPTAFDLQNN